MGSSVGRWPNTEGEEVAAGVQERNAVSRLREIVSVLCGKRVERLLESHHLILQLLRRTAELLLRSNEAVVVRRGSVACEAATG